MFLDLPRLPFPASSEEIFERDGPLVLEIGFGDGRFIEHLAQLHSEHNFIGADIARGSVTRIYKRLQGSKLANLRLYHGSGLFLLRNLLGPESLSEAYINFPDPWRKDKHAKRRLFQPSFFDVLAARLVAHGTLHFTTDHGPYFEHTLSLAKESKHFCVSQKSPPNNVLQTKYARKWQKSGRQFYYMQIQKQIIDSPIVPPNVSKQDSMHHAHLSGSIPQLTNFEKFTHHFQNGHLVILNAMSVIGHQGIIFVCRVHEPELTQDLFLQLRPLEKEGADLLLSVMNWGNPILTRGTSEAVKVVSQWLIKKDLQLSETYY
ncbi:MAG: tRNA (guanosine(46)-N7)-methyltransferase TrmB [Bacteroidetes bacterium]|nr:tRNA (guanosine(46)-N7)-methyltransferase TrmB [Bacteroidota bacterium]